jgi:hypothetical protein
MNGPHEPDRPRAACQEAGRRRSVSQRQTSRQRRQPQDACPQRRRLLDPDHEAFAEWFVAYWRRHGAQLFTGLNSSEGRHT